MSQHMLYLLHTNEETHKHAWSGFPPAQEGGVLSISLLNEELQTP